MASTSSQPLPNSTHPSPSLASYDWKYDVFLSFRGSNTRNNFTAHLYSSLNQNGVNAYKDDKELERGKAIETELLKAIEESMFSIVIFSKDYAFSPWCLDELVKIIECMEMKRQTVLPIFYDVDPSDVSDQKGRYETALVRVAEEFDDNKDKMKMWRKALNIAGNLSGWDVRNRNESEIIQEIVERVWHDLRNTLPIIDKSLVGVDFHLKEMYGFLGEHPFMDVRFIGICGMSGIGKTTIAKVLYDGIRRQFEAFCFLDNVKEDFKNNAVESLQEKIISSITRKQNIKVSDAKSGASEVRKYLKNKKMLLIIDDVDDLEQLNTLAGERDWFRPGSRVIITSQDRHLLSTHGVLIYDVNVLNEEEALKLFSRKAFKQDQPLEDYIEFSKLVLACVGRLPLALSILGSSLHGKSILAWRDAIHILGKGELSDKKIMDILRLSFDRLDELYKPIFLDIACFFRGEDRKGVIRMLDACGFRAHIGIEVLIEKSLISISKDDEIQMHELLQAMGRSIVKLESRNDIGRCSRLWDFDDVQHVLESNTGSKAVEAIVLKPGGTLNISLNSEAFSKMRKLRILILKNVHLSGRPTYLSNELRILEWDHYRLKSLPSSFQTDKLVELKVTSSNTLERLWYGSKVLKHLKILELNYCDKLVESPDFTNIPNLEKLILNFCTKLSKLHPSFEKLEKLEELDLSGCYSLKKLPTSIKMTSLQILNLRKCSMLNTFPTIKGVMPRLQRLCLDETNFKTLPNSIENFAGLVSFKLEFCNILRSLPSSIVHLEKLEELSLVCCGNLHELPDDICKLTSLKFLQLRHSGIKRLPRSTFLLKNLKELCFGGSPVLLRKYDREWAKKLEVLVIPSLCAMVSLEKLELVYCNLVEGSIPDDIGCLSKLTSLNLAGNDFVSLPQSIIQLSELSKLILDDCRMLRSLPEVPPNLSFLSTNGCIALEEIPDPVKFQHPKISSMQCFNCTKLYDSYGGDRIASIMIQQYLKGLSNPRPRFDFFAPGAKIPRWFNNRTERCSVDIPIPMHCNSSEWVGFAACVLFRPWSISDNRSWGILNNSSDLFDSTFASISSDIIPGPGISCSIDYTIDNNERWFSFSPEFDLSMYSKARSYHCWSFYSSFRDIVGLKDGSISHLRLSFQKEAATTKIKMCAARLVSCQEVLKEFKTEDDGSNEFYDMDSGDDDSDSSDSGDLGFFTRVGGSILLKMLDFVAGRALRNL